jgi:hypothetical protein
MEPSKAIPHPQHCPLMGCGDLFTIKLIGFHPHSLQKSSGKISYKHKNTNDLYKDMNTAAIFAPNPNKRRIFSESHRPVWQLKKTESLHMSN